MGFFDADLFEVVRLRAVDGATDAHGNTRRTFVREPWQIFGWEPLETTEDAGTERSIEGVTVYAPTGIGRHDRVELGADLYEVDGEPGDWNHAAITPLWADPEYAIRLRHVEG